MKQMKYDNISLLSGGSNEGTSHVGFVIDLLAHVGWMTVGYLNLNLRDRL